MSDDASELEASQAKSTVDPIKSFLSGGFGGQYTFLQQKLSPNL